MMQITAANAAIFQPPVPSGHDKTYPRRKDAQAAATLAIGPHAREGFEYETSKCDKVWRWHAFDEVKPATAAELKNNGGKRSVLALAKALEGEKAPEHKVAPSATKDIPTASASPSDPHPLAIPEFLKREPETPDVKAKRIAKTAKTSGTNRVIKNPPSIKAAKAKGTKSAGKKTKVAIIAALLMRERGCTRAEVLKACSWPSVSMQQQAALAGLKLRKVKAKGDPVATYFGMPKKG
jgi:hypothetical protein